jgi:hypothetical protein
MNEAPSSAVPTYKEYARRLPEGAPVVYHRAQPALPLRLSLPVLEHSAPRSQWESEDKP